MSKLVKDRDGIRQLLIVDIPGQGLSCSTVHTAHKIIIATIRDAIASNRLSPNTRVPVIKLPPAPKRADVYFPSHEQLTILTHAMPAPYGNLVWLIRGTGLRIGEAMAVTHEGFRRDGTLRITEQLLSTGKLGPLKARAADSYREVPVPRYVSDMMDGHGTGYLFPPVARQTLQRWFVRARDLAGLPPTFTFHSLRHVWASIALSEGIPITDVSRWAGHSSVSFTADIYGHMVPAATVRARSILDREYADWAAGNEHPRSVRSLSEQPAS
jgi:integrase